MKLLHVTRELAVDKRYGLGKSLTPVLKQFEQDGIPCTYLCQTDLSPRNLRWLQRAYRLLSILLKPWLRDPLCRALLWERLMRANMGRVAAKLAARQNYTHVHCHDPLIAAGYRRFAPLYRSRARWGLTEHGFGCYTQALHDDGLPLRHRTMQRLRKQERAVLRAADWVLVPTQAAYRQLARDLAEYPPPAHWRVIPHARPDFPLYSRSEARARLGWSEDWLVVLSVGRLVPLKQFPLVLRACARGQRDNLHLVLLGDGDPAPLQAEAAQYGMSGRLHCTVSDDVGLYYAAADIYVSASQTESFGMANLEALCAGLPSLCTAVGGVPEVLADAAWLLPAEDEAALERALGYLLDNPAAREQLAARARERARHWPDAAWVAAAYQALYERSEAPLPYQAPVAAQAEAIAAAVPELAAIWTGHLAHLRACPLPPALELTQARRVLVIAPHADDEVLSCGGTLALLRQQGCAVRVLVVTDGAAGDPLNYAQGAVVGQRRQECRDALACLDIEDVHFWQEPDGKLAYSLDLQNRLEAFVAAYRPDWLFSPSLLDYHRDHIGVALSLLCAWQQLPQTPRLFFYETWCPQPATALVNISSVSAQRSQAARHYELPLRYCDYLRAFEGLAQYRGLYQGPGQQAESFLELTPETAVSVANMLLHLRFYQEQRMP